MSKSSVPSASTAQSSASAAAAAAAASEVDLLEEDDEFEEFAEETWSAQPNPAVADHAVFAEQWDDELADDKFLHQLRQELASTGGQYHRT